MSEYDSTPQRRPGEHEPPEHTSEPRQGEAGAQGEAGVPGGVGAPGAPGAERGPYEPEPYRYDQPTAQQPTVQPAAPVSGAQWHSAAPAADHQQTHPGWPGQPAYGVPQHQQHLGGGQPAHWGPTTTIGHQERPSRAGKALATGAAAIVLAVASGLLGGVIATTIDDQPSASTVAADTSRAAAAPVINRSSLAEIAAKVQPSVVQIQTGSGEGSGVIITGDGSILTNNHVVESARGNQVQVSFNDGKKATATVVGTDPKTDLAVIKAQGVSGLSAAKFGDSDAMQIGDTVLALGSPLDLKGSVTAGIVSAKDRTIQVGGDQQQQVPGGTGGQSSLSGLLQTDAAINPGNSGGALVNTNAELIGINSAIATSGQGSGNIGIGFAIPSNKAKQVADALSAGKKVSHPFLGVQVGNGQNGGALVSGVTGGSPAAKAGLQEGDIITKIGGKTVGSSDDLVAAVQGGKVGDQLTVTYTRNGSEKTATVTLGEAS